MAYPKQIQGVWQKGYEPCKLPGNLDSDGRKEIKSKVIHNYEDTSTPIEVVHLAKQPQAWKIKSSFEIDGYTTSGYEIYILSGKAIMTIVSASSSSVFTRCN